MLHTSTPDLCIFWQPLSWQCRPSALGKNPRRPRKHARRSRPFFPIHKNKEGAHRRWQESSATSGRQHASVPSEVLVTRRGSFVFSSFPIVPRIRRARVMFLLDDKRVSSPALDYFHRERAAGKCWAVAAEVNQSAQNSKRLHWTFKLKCLRSFPNVKLNICSFNLF